MNVRDHPPARAKLPLDGSKDERPADVGQQRAPSRDAQADDMHVVEDERQDGAAASPPGSRADTALSERRIGLDRVDRAMHGVAVALAAAMRRTAARAVESYAEVVAAPQALVTVAGGPPVAPAATSGADREDRDDRQQRRGDPSGARHGATPYRAGCKQPQHAGRASKRVRGLTNLDFAMDDQRERGPQALVFATDRALGRTDQEAEVRATLYAPPTERERTVQPVSPERRMRPAA